MRAEGTPEIRRGASCLLATTLALALTPGAASAAYQDGEAREATATRQAASEEAGDRVYRGDEGRIHARPPRIDQADVSVDGVLDEPVWERAIVLTGFTQYDPVEGAPPAERTEVLVFYTGEAMYFGIRAHDRQPERIEARIGERDRSVFADDWVRIMLDTYNDERRAYLFYINPYGIQTDGLWLEGLERQGGFGMPIDFNPDFIWQSKGRVTAEGWEAEVRIPYVSLRFEARPEQTWGINVMREVRRTRYKQAWAPITEDVSSTLSQNGRLVGLQGLAPRRLVEINPVTTGSVVGSRQEEGPFRRGGLEPELGVNARVGLTTNLVLGATANPDFSQVEADADQITVNERFAIFFSEKRPFFLEGTEIFESPTRLVHTRQIVDPMGGAKITGKVGGTSLAYLGALDESPVSLGDGEHEALFNLLRLRQDVGAGSSLGVLYTDRTLTGGGAFNRVAAADARLLLGGRHTLTAQAAGSWTRPESGAEVDFAPLLLASYTRSGRNLGWELGVEDIHPDFRTESGFIRRVGDLRAEASAQVTFFGAPGAALESYGFELETEGFFDHADFWSGEEMAPFESEVQLQTNLSFRGGRFVALIVRDAFFTFRADEYVSYGVRAEDGSAEAFQVPDALTHMVAGGFFTRSQITPSITLGGRYFLRETPIFAEAARGRELLLVPSLTIRAGASLQTEVSYAFSRIWRTRDGSHFSSADIPRLKLQYQFTPAFFVRGIFQYDLQERDALRDPRTERPLLVGGEEVEARESGRFLTQLLVSYEPSPGTIFFVGWSRQEEGERALGLGHMEPVAESFFAKLSYLFRL